MERDPTMSKKSLLLSCCVFVMVTVIIFCSGFFQNAMADDDPHMTGLPELTHEELEWQNKNMTRARRVRLNKLALERINKWRKDQGDIPLKAEEAGVVPDGQEIEGIKGEPSVLESVDAGDFPFPSMSPYVDNSALKYFPPIRSQGSLPSCGCFSGTYYAMTYMHAFARDLDAKDGGDDYRFSPKWTYNMVNNGQTQGSWYYHAYEIGMKHGVATWAEFPYDSDYRAWSLDQIVWRNSIDRRFNEYGYVANTHLDSGIEQVKQMLTDGYVLNFPTYINSWQYKTISNDPGTTEDDLFVGKNCCFWVNGTDGYHAMTVVGYNDNIWVDINGNGIIDTGEKGAFRIANSWGTGWREGGFCWMAYDALKNPSAVDGGPGTNRIYGWSPSRAHWVTARSSYEPSIVAEFTLNHSMRNQLRISLGISDTSSTVPTTIWYPEMIYFQGGPYAFDGTTTACDATFVFDFTDIAPAGGELNRYYLALYDSTTGNTALLYDYKIIDVANGGIEVICDEVPKEADAGEIYAYLDYDFDNGNILPVAVSSADPLSGQAPLNVTFDGSGSYDPDGQVISYEWDFGDGGSGSGVSVTHVYGSAGTYSARLMVTDNMGAIDEDDVIIEVQQDPSEIIHVQNIDMSLIPVSGGLSAQARVMIAYLDPDPIPMAGAVVTGEWGGILNGPETGVTGSDGTITFTSRKTKNSGIISFRVIDVSAAGYVYDEGQNNETEDSISTDEPVNKNPVAEAMVYPTTGVAPLTVNFDGSGSNDPDGVIVSYNWDFGDGNTGSGQTESHDYNNTGTYSAILTVTDDQGATDSTSITINVTSDLIPVIYVNDIVMTILPVPGGNAAQAEVVIMDQDGGVVSNATVTSEWSGIVSGTDTGNTDDGGRVVFISNKSKKTGDFVFTVTNVSAEGYIYDPVINNETSDSIQNTI